MGENKAFFSYDSQYGLMRRLDYGDINKVTYFVDGLYELEENGSEKAHKFISKDLQL